MPGPAPMLAAAALLLLAGCGDDGGPEPDTSPPQILQTEPGDGATGVAPDTLIRVFFDEAVDNQRFAWDDSLYLIGPGDQKLYGNGSYDLEEHAASLRMAFDMLAGATYTVVLERGVCDLLGNCMSQATQWSFTIAQ